MSKEIEDAILVGTPTMALAQIVDNSGLDPDIQQYMRDLVHTIVSKAEEWDTKIKALKPSGPDDIKTMKEAAEGVKFLADVRKEGMRIVNAQRKAVQAEKASYDLQDKAWLRTGQLIEKVFKPMEAECKEIADYREKYELLQKELKANNRWEEIKDLCESKESYPLADMPEGDFINLKAYLTEKKEKADAEAKAEADRLAKIEADRLQEIEDQRLENIRLKAEAEQQQIINDQLEADRVAAENARIAAEAETRRIQDEAANKIREAEEAKQKVQQEAEDKRKADAQAAIDAENARLAAEQKEADRIAAEERAEEDRIAQEILDARAAEEEKAKASLVNKLEWYIDDFQAGTPHESIKDEVLTNQILEKFNAFKKWARKEVDKL